MMMRITGISLTIAVMCIAVSGIAFGQIVPKEARQRFTRGIAAVEMAKSIDDYKSAAHEFELAKKLAPDWPDVYYNLGMILEKTGDYEDAINNLKTYLRLVPSSSDARQVQEIIYKLEYKRERSNIEGIWRVDRSNLNVRCHPNGFRITPGGMSSSQFIVEDIVLEIKKELNGYKARILSSKSRFGHILSLPDGSYVSMKREGDMAKIFEAKLYVCKSNISSDNCPCMACFVLEQVSADTFKGTVKISGTVKEAFGKEFVGLGCEGKIVLLKQDVSR